MKKPIVSILFLLVMTEIYSQKPAFIPIIDPQLKPVETFITGEADKLYYTSIKTYMGFAKGGMTLNAWNGQFHTTYPVYVPESFYSGNDNRSSICLHQDTLYMAGSFSSENQKDAGIVKWNGTSWVKAGSGIWSDYPIHPEISVRKLVSLGQALWACGSFNQTGAGNSNGLAYYTQDWNNVSVNGRVNDLLKIGDTLYAAGAFSLLDGQTCNQIAYLTGGNWRALPDPNMGEILQLGSLGGKLIALSKNQIRLYENGIWTILNSAWSYETIYTGSMAEYNQTLYISGVFKDQSGLIHHLLEWDGNSWKSLVNETHINKKNGKRFYIQNIKGHLYFGGQFTNIYNTPAKHLIELFPKHSIISGFLYNDKNQNCVMDAADERMKNAIISVNAGAYYFSTDEYGYYELALSPGKTHSLQVFPGSGFKIACGQELSTIATPNTDQYLELDIGFQELPAPPSTDYIRLTCDRGYKVKHGFDAHYSINVAVDESRYPFELVLNYPIALKAFQTEIQALKIEDDKVTWLIESPAEIRFKLNVDPVYCQMGDRLTLRAEIQTGTRLLRDELQQEVVSAYDPNDKQCSETSISTGTRALDYRIRFQNLGNIEATHVYVVDTISRTMPMQFLKVLDYSHKASYKVNFKVRDHAVIWGFENINLGAKQQVGDELSSGYIQFTTGLENSLRIGDSITNQAAIYFDFQPAVFTNTVVTKVVSYSQPGNTTGLYLNIYPNPNKGSFVISLEPYNIQKVEMFDLSGRMVYSQAGEMSGQTELETEGLSAGIYLVKVYHALGVVTKAVVINP